MLGALLNLEAVAAHARESGVDYTVDCAGYKGAFAIDDAYCAGRIIRLAGGERTDAAIAARARSPSASRTGSTGSTRAPMARPGWRRTSPSAPRRACSTWCRASAGWSARRQKSSRSRVPAPAPVDAGAAEPAVAGASLGLSRENLAAERRQRHAGRQELPRVAERRRRRQLLDQRHELGQPLPRPGVARGRPPPRAPGSPRRARRAASARPAAARAAAARCARGRCGRRATPRAGAAAPGRGGEAPAARGRASSARPVGSGARNASHASRASARVCSDTDRRAGQSASSPSGGKGPRSVVRLDQLEPRVAGERQRLQQLQLVVEVGLEPEDDVGTALERTARRAGRAARATPAASAPSPSRTRSGTAPAPLAAPPAARPAPGPRAGRPATRAPRRRARSGAACCRRSRRWSRAAAARACGSRPPRARKAAPQVQWSSESQAHPTTRSSSSRTRRRLAIRSSISSSFCATRVRTASCARPPRVSRACSAISSSVKPSRCASLTAFTNRTVSSS